MPDFVAESGCSSVPTAPHWLHALRFYIGGSAIGHLVWEVAQIPLYTMWVTDSIRQIAFAVLHCTGGDVLIALASLAGALLLCGNSRWPGARFRSVAIATLVFGFTYTVYSEWVNVNVRGTWAYGPAMPVLPPFGTGLAPAAQWIVIPSLVFKAIGRTAERRHPESAHGRS